MLLQLAIGRLLAFGGNSGSRPTSLFMSKKPESTGSQLGFLDIKKTAVVSPTSTIAPVRKIFHVLERTTPAEGRKKTCLR